ncbi:hypothetical protein [Paenibacillus sp. RC67]|uniref:hypothetical protein n=1 Tax=Paenibacillus sp. RC67 TaxID=3039392 RepID=UPI0024AD4D8A|nr:hypothetical protein [Paenibacillus sp. RC67]
MALNLMRPVRFLFCYLAEDIGSSISSLVNKALPMFIIIAVLFHIPLPVSPVATALFLVSAVLSYAILWLLSALVGLVAFWVTALGPLDVIKICDGSHLIRQIDPSVVFSRVGTATLAFTPFPYTY